jgi:hypothetical protein
MAGVWALERPRGREWASLGRFGAAHRRVHRYLPTSLHNEKQHRTQCMWRTTAVSVSGATQISARR